MVAADREHEMNRASLRSAVYAMIAQALREPEAGENVDQSYLRGILENAALPLEGIDQEPAGLAGLAISLGRLLEGEVMGVLDERRDQYFALFGHAVRAACPPYELEYGESDIPQQSRELADISGFYQAFGMTLRGDAHERADHVTVECEFMGVLAAKSAYAIENDDRDGAEIIDDAQRSFLADHTGRWLPAFALRLQDADPDGFYGGAGKVIEDFIMLDCAAFGVEAGHRFMELRPIDPQRDAAIQCGAEESCPGGSDPQAPGTGDQIVQVGIDHT